MKKTLFTFAAAAAISFCCNCSYAQSRQERLEKHVSYLASDSLKGRKAGSPDAEKAAGYIVGELVSAGVKPFFKEGWYDSFSLPKSDEETGYRNVVGVIEGSDPVLKKEYIVIGAHYDHLGVKHGQIYNGADDNASGSAAVIEVARDLCSRRSELKRSVIIAAFDAEELGLFGSSHLAERLSEEKLTVRVMMSIDMVGWLKEGKALKLEGVATIRDGKRILAEKASANTLSISTKNFETSILTATDTQGFAQNGIPTLAVTTGLKSPYHKPEDDADKIDYPGLDKVSGYIGDVTAGFSSDESLRPSGKVARKHREISDFGVDFGLMAGINRSSYLYTQSQMMGKRKAGFQAGLTARANLKYVGIIADAIFMQDNSVIPTVKGLDIEPGKLRQNEILIPVNVVFQLPKSMTDAGFFVGGGAYWSKALSQTMTGAGEYVCPSDEGYGLCWTLGVDIFYFSIGGISMYQLGNAFPNASGITGQKRSGMVFFKYHF